MLLLATLQSSSIIKCNTLSGSLERTWWNHPLVCCWDSRRNSRSCLCVPKGKKIHNQALWLLKPLFSQITLGKQRLATSYHYVMDTFYWTYVPKPNWAYPCIVTGFYKLGSSSLKGRKIYFYLFPCPKRIVQEVLDNLVSKLQKTHELKAPISLDKTPENRVWEILTLEVIITENILFLRWGLM